MPSLKNCLQGRSGSVALPRTKLVEAMAAMGLVVAAGRPARTAGDERRSVEAIVIVRREWNWTVFLVL